MAANQLEFYRARAEQSRADADAATLEHVRERCRRSEAAWTTLADRAERNELMRAAEDKRKADLKIAESPESSSPSPHPV